MYVLGTVLDWALTLLFWCFLGRFFLELYRSLNRSFRPTGIFLLAAEAMYSISDPPLKFLRRFIKPIRLGSFQIDFAWTVAILLIGVLQTLVRVFIIW